MFQRACYRAIIQITTLPRTEAIEKTHIHTLHTLCFAKTNMMWAVCWPLQLVHCSSLSKKVTGREWEIVLLQHMKVSKCDHMVLCSTMG